MGTIAHAKSQWTVSTGHKFIIETKQEGIVQIEPTSFASTGDENYIAAGIIIDKLHNISIGIEIDTEYINVDQSHTLAFAAKILFAQQLLHHHGYLYIGGAFGYGIDRKDGSSFIDVKTGTQYTTQGDPRFIYSRIDIGLTYAFSNHFSILLGIESACRAYDLQLKSQTIGISNAPSLLNTYEAESRSVDLITHSAILSVSYQF